MTKNQLIKHLQSQFPELWLKDGSLFDGSKERILWAGESSLIEGWPAFDFMFLCNDGTYIDGVHNKLREISEELGLYWEFYDGGTAFAYKI